VTGGNGDSGVTVVTVSGDSGDSGDSDDTVCDSSDFFVRPEVQSSDPSQTCSDLG
jgi:hypothetical protein